MCIQHIQLDEGGNLFVSISNAVLEPVRFLHGPYKWLEFVSCTMIITSNDEKPILLSKVYLVDFFDNFSLAVIRGLVFKEQGEIHIQEYDVFFDVSFDGVDNIVTLVADGQKGLSFKTNSDILLKCLQQMYIIIVDLIDKSAAKNTNARAMKNIIAKHVKFNWFK